jgi:hypothetical protein
MPTNLPTHAFTLMCEDIRQEDQGKMSILGLYTEKIFFKETPMRMRSLGFLTRFSGGNGVFHISIKLKGPTIDLIPILKVDEAAHFPQSVDSEVSTLGMLVGSVEFKEQGWHAYEVYFEGIVEPVAHFRFHVAVRSQ